MSIAVGIDVGSVSLKLALYGRGAGRQALLEFAKTNPQFKRIEQR